MNQRDVEIFVMAYKQGLVPLKSVALVVAMYRAQIGEPMTPKDILDATGCCRSKAYKTAAEAVSALQSINITLSPDRGQKCPRSGDKSVPEVGTKVSPKWGRHLLRKVEEKTPPYIPPHGGGAEGFAPQGSPKPEPNPRPARRPSKRRDPEGYRRQLEADLADLED